MPSLSAHVNPFFRGVMKGPETFHRFLIGETNIQQMYLAERVCFNK